MTEAAFFDIHSRVPVCRAYEPVLSSARSRRCRWPLGGRAELLLAERLRRRLLVEWVAIARAAQRVQFVVVCWPWLGDSRYDSAGHVPGRRRPSPSGYRPPGAQSPRCRQKRSPPATLTRSRWISCADGFARRWRLVAIAEKLNRYCWTCFPYSLLALSDSRRCVLMTQIPVRYNYSTSLFLSILSYISYNDHAAFLSVIMRPSSLGGGRILRRTLSVRLSVRPSRYHYRASRRAT